jgi:hypothetical protein
MMRVPLLSCLLVAGLAGRSAAQPPLAQIQDDQQLAQALAAITNDPAIPVSDPALRAEAQALMIEGVRQLQARSYDQALANFLEAYGRFPSPKILLNIGSTLRDMGRLADAANTYQRYLADPASGSDRVAEVKELLIRLDEQLTLLTIRVVPRGSEVSIDAGPFVAVGSSLVTRVRPGLHLVRIRHGEHADELTVNGFEGENKEVLATLKLPEPASDPELPRPPEPARDPEKPAPPRPPDPPDQQQGWLITGQYGSDGTGNKRSVLTRTAGEPITAITPAFDLFDDGLVVTRAVGGERISSGVVAVLRIDGEGRGFAGGLGLAIARGRFEGDLMVLRSNQTGGYLGFRYRFLTGFFRPYAALGIPGFVFENTILGEGGMTSRETKLAIGARVAAGLELYINGHLSVQADVGYEHFWFVENTNPRIDADVWVPTIGVIGRL